MGPGDGKGEQHGGERHSSARVEDDKLHFAQAQRAGHPRVSGFHMVTIASRPPQPHRP